jgi:hypothetical protein
MTISSSVVSRMAPPFGSAPAYPLAGSANHRAAPYPPATRLEPVGGTG